MIISLPSDFILSLKGIRLELLSNRFREELAIACQDGNLWELNFTSTPSPDKVQSYIETALTMPDRIAFAVIDESTGRAIGTTSYHDILPQCKRLEIGYTWYAKSYWRTHVNTSCKLLLLQYAFENLAYKTVGLRIDSQNQRSQIAIERLGAKKDGIIRGNRILKDGLISDTVMYSLIDSEWENSKNKLMEKLNSY